MGIFSLIKMAWRNLWRNKRRTLITMSSITVAAFLSIMMTGMQDKSWSDLIDKVARNSGGHVTLQHPEYLDKPTLTRTVSNVSQKEALVRKTNDVTHVVSRISGQLLLATARDSFGAGFIAIDPKKENKETFSIIEAIKEGHFFKTSKDRGIILGKTLAKNLGAKIGKKVVYTLTNKDGDIVNGLARVSGIIDSGSPSLDLRICLLPIDTVRKVLGYQSDEATKVAIFLNDNRNSNNAVNELHGQFRDGTSALTWKQTQPDLVSFIAMKKGGTIFFEILVLILCAAGIFNTMFVSVMERLREFGILMAVGFSTRRIFILIMLESLWLSLIGLVCTVIVTAWPYNYMNTIGIDMSKMVGTQDGQSVDIAGVGMNMILKVGIYPDNAIYIAIVVVIATMLAGLYPAWKATGIEPVETIRLV